MRRTLRIGLACAATTLAWSAVRAADTNVSEQLARWSASAAAPADAERGRNFFAARHGGEWSCSTCHGTPPVKQGRHAVTGKTIAPLAPAANPRAFTETARVDRWLRRNCNDVLRRECSAQEKADLLAYLNRLER